jgi:hypothetical protein
MEIFIQKYSSPEQVRVGDVVMLDGDSLSPFATSIVTGIEDFGSIHHQIFLGRPHARCSSHRIRGHHRGEQVAVMVETYPVEAHRFVEIYSVFVSGPKGEIDNRNGIYTSEMVAKKNKAGETVRERGFIDMHDPRVTVPKADQS